MRNSTKEQIAMLCDLSSGGSILDIPESANISGI
jgi:hypothetical protein